MTTSPAVPVELREAVAAHRTGQLEKAISLYRSAINKGRHSPPIFQNLGAILRQQEKTAEALKVYNLGLSSYPNDPGILANRANILRKDKPVEALYDLLDALKRAPGLINAWITAISILRDHKAFLFAIHTTKQALEHTGLDARILVNMLQLLDEVEGESGRCCDDLLEDLIQTVERKAGELSLHDQCDALFSLAFCCAQHDRIHEAEKLYHETLQRLTPEGNLEKKERENRDKIITNHSWNLGCMLLKAQNLKEGWKLYDYGLRVPAEGQQKWQRALRKHFSAAELPIWRGESLAAKKLLLLEEQGIGDSMMFLTLIPSLLEEADGVGIILSDRLAKMYRRAFEGKVDIWTHQEVQAGKVRPSQFDVQSPLGSICRYRFTTIQSYAPGMPVFHVDAEQCKALRERYLSELASQDVSRLVGISWKGGGTKDRIRKKSPPIEIFERLLQDMSGVGFLSLQYGDVGELMKRWQGMGLNVLHDPEVDPLTDMDRWIHQVAACDAVLSVACTTIHGAGGLNLPTMCLLSRDSDWRWFDDASVERSYWYPSVGIAREEKAAGWKPAFQKCRQWLQAGCPMPTGITHTISED